MRTNVVRGSSMIIKRLRESSRAIRRHRSVRGAAARVEVQPLEDRRLFAVAAAPLEVTFNGTKLDGVITEPFAGGNDPTASQSDGTDLGGIRQGDAGVSRTFTVKNVSASPIGVQNFAFAYGTPGVDAAFKVDTNFPPGGIPAGGSAQVTVTLLSDQPGLKEDIVALSSTGGDFQGFTFKIRGYVSAKGEELGTLSSNAVNKSDQVAVTTELDGSGTHPRGHESKTYLVNLTGDKSELFLDVR